MRVPVRLPAFLRHGRHRASPRREPADPTVVVASEVGADDAHLDGRADAVRIALRRRFEELSFVD